MRNRMDPKRTKREAAAARKKKREGPGAVPNVPRDPANGEKEELKEAFHELEEQKGDWSKGH
jgi:hypothetical protein